MNIFFFKRRASCHCQPGRMSWQLLRLLVLVLFCVSFILFYIFLKTLLVSSYKSLGQHLPPHSQAVLEDNRGALTSFANSSPKWTYGHWPTHHTHAPPAHKHTHPHPHPQLSISVCFFGF